MRKILALAFVFSSLFILAAFAEEEITITTYYPSPFGSYRELRSQRVAIGDNYLNGATFTWEETAGDGGEVRNDTDLIVEGRVGIGTATPNNLFQVRDYINFGEVTQLGGDPQLANTFLGYGTGRFNTTGTTNVGVGYDALVHNTVGNNNTGLGSGALVANTSGSDNTAVGYEALINSTKNSNTAIGSYSLFANTTGEFNTAIGEYALNASTATSYETAVGYSALRYNKSGGDNTAVGGQALQGSLTQNNIVSGNTAVGFGSLRNTYSASGNSAVGSYSLVNNTTGNRNVAFGYQTLWDTFTGSDNVALGYKAGYSSTGSGNTFLGANTNSAPGIDNSTAIGNGSYTTQNYQIAIGNTTDPNLIYLNGTAYLDIKFQEQSFSNQGWSNYKDYSCPIGYVILSGGIDCNLNSGRPYINESRPVDPRTWRGRCGSNDLYSGPSIYFHLTCIKIQDIG